MLDKYVKVDPATGHASLDWPPRYSAKDILRRFPKIGAIVMCKYDGAIGVVVDRRPTWNSRPGSGCIGWIRVVFINDGGPSNRFESFGSVELFQPALDSRSWDIEQRKVRR